MILLAHFGRPKGRDAEGFAASRSPRRWRRCIRQAGRVSPRTASARSPNRRSRRCRTATSFAWKTPASTSRRKSNDPAFVAELAQLGDIWVNDAFSAAHRAHASTEGLGHKLPAYAGRSMQAELDALAKALETPTKPVIAIIGGAKVSTKIDLLENLVSKVDALVIGGGMANTFLHAQGFGIGKSLAEKDLAATALRIIARAEAANCAIILPVDAVVAFHFAANSPSQAYGVDAIPADGMILDVGPQSIARIYAAIDDAKTLVWNGPLGAFEMPPFDRGTVLAARHAAERTKRQQAGLGGRWRRYRGGAEPGRRGRRFQLCFDRRRRVS